ncbi:DUF7935 family protein [Flavobacterium quisquiliarum]|uniref:Uncharacterized protein n=1 Tax=Flavobacterium quisquiliarum TaxID=1834436 RepID=A0ABV8W0F4_9FLAO|nr:hypothetical protein [Flavobacterium quisquiliarum]MBW1658576.1 hypothetical protein [Flavobacterium quisquiliarum]NWL02460.1 hypothetical protein [Flavobacterium collinsii]
MDFNKIIELASYTLPAIVTGFVAYRFFELHIKNNDRKRAFLLNKQAHKESLPIRLQAFERMTLFLERINLTKLLIRIAPISQNKHDYENFLIDQIEQEFEHNLTQQIYMSEECWTIIATAKNATIQMIRKAAMSDKIENADKLREVILNDLLEKQPPSNAALSFIKSEVAELW